MNTTITRGFFECHQHTSRGSIGDAICSVSDLVKTSVENGVSHVAITEHGNLNSFADLYFECKKNNLIPVAGVEAYLCDNRDEILELQNKKDRDANYKEEISNLYNNSIRHVVLLAYNEVGYKNLLRLIYESMHNFYRKPLLTINSIKNHCDGLFATTACINGVIGKSFRKQDINEMYQYAKTFKDIFGDNLFIELTVVDVDKANEYNTCLIILAKKLGIKTSISNDVHFCKKSDWWASYILHALRENLTLQDIQNINETNRKKIEELNDICKETYLKTLSEIYNYWKNNLHTSFFTEKVFWQSIDNTEEFFVNKVGNFVPNIISSIPRPKDTNFDDLMKEVVLGAKRRNILNKKEYMDRLLHELNIIKKLKIDSYIDVLYDFVSWTKKNYGITSMAPARGSSAASLVLYCLGITEVDPIKHKLLFERFLDESKIISGSGPDVDLDFAQNIHPYVKEYVCNKFPNNVGIGTIQEYKWKSVIKDVLRFYNVPFEESNELTKDIDVDLENKTINDFKEILPNVYNKLIELIGEENIGVLDVLHGTMRASGSHPAGIVIGDKNSPLMECIPYYRYNDVIVSGWDGDTLSDLGYYKYDMLRVSNVQVIDDTLSLIREKRRTYVIKGHKCHLPKFLVEHLNLESKPVDIDIYRDCDLNDINIYNFANNTTNGYDSIFQLGTPIAKQFLSRFKPTCFEHLVAINSILRPATIRYGATEVFLRRHEGIEQYEIPQCLQHILGDTYGIIVYQEQCMQICMEIGGFSPIEANKIRKLLIKKSDVNEVNKFKLQFIENAKKKIGEQLANQIWDEMVRMSEYAFCRAHAVSYTIISVFDMWLKYYYGFEFYVSVLNNLGEKNLDKISEVIEVINNKNLLFHIGNKSIEYNVKVLPPDITQPSINFTLDDKYHIRYGLKYIKGIKSNDFEKILKYGSSLRNFYDFLDFVDKQSINKTTVYGLIFSGACDVFNKSRNDMWYEYIKYFKYNDEYDFSLNELLSIEKDLIGINFDLIGVCDKIDTRNTIKQVNEQNEGMFEISIQVSDIKHKISKNNKPYCVISFGGNFNIFAWNSVLEKIKKENIAIGDILRCIIKKENNFINLVKFMKENIIYDQLLNEVKYQKCSNIERITIGKKDTNNLQLEFEIA